ncbi:MAG: PAS domain S-box protein [Sphingobacteriales bacterium]|nr:MAG: PAS domain S-box protein [Sphingobacteriales bacterium]
MTNTIEQTAPEMKSTQFDFIHFPGFAGFILENHLPDYVREQLIVARQMNVPLLKFFSHLTDEQLIEVGTPGHIEFLTYAKDNRLDELLNVSLERWKNDQLAIQNIAKTDVAAEDITLLTYVRKRCLLKFLPLYTTDPYEIIEVIKETEAYDTISVTASANVYIDILKEQIQEHTHFIETITNTTPGLNYVYNIAEGKMIYANRNYEDYLGYALADLKTMGPEMFRNLVHPDDLVHSASVFRRFENAGNGQVISWEQRLKNHKDEYKWLRHHASVFKRDASGQAIEIVGIALDIDLEKRTAEELIKSEESLLESQILADMASYEMDVATQLITVSPNFYNITRQQPGFARSKYLENVHPGDRAKVNESLRKTLENGAPYETEYRYTVDGKEKIIWSRGRLYEENGKRTIRGTLMDVTERYHIIQKLQRSEELYKQAQALSHIGNWSWFIATNRITWSDELYNIFGIKNREENITYDRYISLIHPDDKSKLIDAIEHSLKTHQPYDLTHRILLDNGQIKVIHSKGEVLLSPEGQPFKIAGTGQDVTEKHYTEERLRENQEFIRKVADTTPSLIASYNIKTGEYTYLNKAFTKILGYEVEEVMEKGMGFVMEIIHPDDVEMVMEKNAAALAEANAQVPEDGNELTAEFKYRLRHKNGKYHWFHTYGTIFDRDAEGKVEHILNVSVDITDQEEAEQTLYRKNILLQQSNASLEEFAYVASHDLKEPLRKIATFGDRLMSTQYENLDDSGKAFIDKIIDSSRRMQTMINDLLNISIISGNKSFSPTNLREILDDALAALEFKIEEKGAVIKSDNLPVANIVVSQFRHLFQNLISNSLKFSRAGVTPEITVSCQYLTPQEVEDPTVTKAARYLSISVADNGIGFDNQYANKIFTIFQRLHSKTDYEGNGIGLAICRKIAENHGGTIFATGVLNQGSTFTVIIPA